MRTDSLFYQLFQNYPNILFELLGNPSTPASSYSFTSQEVKQTSFRIDGIFVPTSNTPDLPIYFVEFQGYRDSKGDLYPSFLSEIYLYLNDYRPQNDWRGVLIFTQRRLDPGIPQHYQEYAHSQRLQRIYLDELPTALTNYSLGFGILQLIGLRKEITPQSAQQLITRVQQELIDPTEQRQLIELVETVLIYKLPDKSRQEIEAMLGLNELKQTRVYQEALEEGLEQGREQGLEQGKLAAVPLLLQAGLSVEQIAD